MGGLNPMANRSTALKVQPTATELALADVAHAVSADTTRPHLCSPFGGAHDGRGYIIGTDGHRMALVRDAAWSSALRADAPPFAHLVQWAAPFIGSLAAGALEDGARLLPSKWDTELSWHCDGEPLLQASVLRGPGKKARKIHPLGLNVRVPWGLRLTSLRHALGITLPYLVDAIDFVGTGIVDVFNAGAFDPIFFTSHGTSIAEAERFALVMPRRQ